MEAAYRSEGDVETKLLQPLFRDILGYPNSELSWKAPVRITLGREVRTKQADLIVSHRGEPTHAARQLPSGAWTSKLGEWEDIEHDTLEALEGSEGRGEAYGRVALILKRERR